MKIELTDGHKAELVRLIEEDLAYVHEMLRDDHETLGAAMTAFDNLPGVEVLCQLDRGKYDRLRKAVEEEIEGYVEDDEDDEDDD